MNELGTYCFVCDSSGEIFADYFKAWGAMCLKSLIYQVGFSVINDIEVSYSKFGIRSNNYSQATLDRACDYFQLADLKKRLPRSISSPDLFMTPSDDIYDELMGLLKTEEAKVKLHSWLRGEGTVFPNKN